MRKHVGYVLVDRNGAMFRDMGGFGQPLVTLSIQDAYFFYEKPSRSYVETMNKTAERPFRVHQVTIQPCQ